MNVLTFHMLYVFFIVSKFAQQHCIGFRVVLKFHSVDYLTIDILKGTLDDFDSINDFSFD